MRTLPLHHFTGRRARLLALLAALAALALPAAAFAHDGGSSGKGSGHHDALVPASLLADAKADEDATFDVIVQGTKTSSSASVAKAVADEKGKLKRQFFSITGVSAELTGKELVKLARHPHVGVITPNVPTFSAYENSQMWPQTTAVESLWSRPATLSSPAYVEPQAPAIAIIDSGVDAARAADFGSRVVASVNFCSTEPGVQGDPSGHGTMVASVAAGASSSYPGVARNAPLVSVRTSNSQGMSRTADVVAAVDWVLQNRFAYNIRVVNLSQTSATQTSIRFDPLDRAVERLWLNGVVVVAAAGNHGSDGSRVSMAHAPGNDPFVITVGATDQRQTTGASDDFTAPWSAFGHTAEGFRKPELAAPGRYLIMAVPQAGAIPAQFPQRVVGPGYMWMSGTSFSSPMVAGIAAQMLALHPDWTPDQVKGSLMKTALRTSETDFSAGVGSVHAYDAATNPSPPSANRALQRFVYTDAATGMRAFDAEAWATVARSDANWDRANWDDANWDGANWDGANWDGANWDGANWDGANWDGASYAQATANQATFAQNTGLQ